MPLSDTLTKSFGILEANSLLKSKLTSKVLRLRLFTPIISSVGIIDFSNSSKLCTSSKTSSPKLLANWDNDWISSRVKTAAMSRIKSAPWALASRIWYSSTMNSFRNKGIFTEALAKSKSSSEPPKYLPSVSTEIPQAPAFS